MPETPSNSSNNMSSSSNTSSTNSSQIIPEKSTHDQETSAHDKALSIVSYIGCGISIISLLATIIIILLFRSVAMYYACVHCARIN